MTMLPPIDNRVGERIARRREELDLTQRDVVTGGKFTSSYLSLVEAGRRKPSWEMLCAIAAALNDNPFRLADGTARQLVKA